MANLTWDNYDAQERVLYLEQSKRRARVELPTTDELHEMLMQQKGDVDFQQYIAPYCMNKRIIARPYNKFQLSHIARQIMDQAGLPKELQIMDMRRTGIMEMVDAGVSFAQIQSVSGHANPQSMKPYLKNTLTSARSACAARASAKA
jgi:integrase